MEYSDGGFSSNVIGGANGAVEVVDGLLPLLRFENMRSII